MFDSPSLVALVEGFEVRFDRERSVHGRVLGRQVRFVEIERVSKIILSLDRDLLFASKSSTVLAKKCEQIKNARAFSSLA